MGYINPVRDSKSHGAINHFKIPLRGIRARVMGHDKKDAHTLNFDVTLESTTDSCHFSLKNI
jgi:hypothetical protein